MKNRSICILNVWLSIDTLVYKCSRQSPDQDFTPIYPISQHMKGSLERAFLCQPFTYGSESLSIRLIEGKTPTFIHVVFKFPPTSWTLETWSHWQNSSTATLVRCGVLQTERTDLSKTFHDGKYSIEFCRLFNHRKNQSNQYFLKRKIFNSFACKRTKKNQSFGRSEQVNNFWGPKCLQNFEKQAYSVGSSYSSVLRVLIRGIQAWSYEFYKPLC